MARYGWPSLHASVAHGPCGCTCRHAPACIAALGTPHATSFCLFPILLPIPIPIATPGFLKKTYVFVEWTWDLQSFQLRIEELKFGVVVTINSLLFSLSATTSHALFAVKITVLAFLGVKGRFEIMGNMVPPPSTPTAPEHPLPGRCIEPG